MTKKENETALINTATALFDQLRLPWYRNYQGYHTRGRDRGRPDLEVIYKGITWFLEFKNPKTGGKMSAYQLKHKEMIEAAGAPYLSPQSIDEIVKAMGLPVLLS